MILCQSKATELLLKGGVKNSGFKVFKNWSVTGLLKNILSGGSIPSKRSCLKRPEDAILKDDFKKDLWNSLRKLLSLPRDSFSLELCGEEEL
jgi:hypothetical protein